MLVQALSPGLRRQFREATAMREGWLAHRDEDAPAQQLAAIRRVWADAIADVPYYQQLAAEGRAPKAIDDWSSLGAIPILTRQVLQDRGQEFVRRSGRAESVMQTAGSTGTPLAIGMNHEERDLMRVVKLAAWQSFGYQPSSRLFIIWGHAHLLGTGWRGQLNHLKRRIKDAAIGYRRVNAYRLNEAICREFAEQLLAFRPIGLIGYAAALDLFARYTQSYRDRFRALDMRFVLATTEPPPAADTLTVLEDLFGCPVVQEYGGVEFGQVAFKAGARPFETYAGLNYVETEAAEPSLPDAKPLLITSLYPRYLPLIRYRIGDAVISPVVLDHGHVTRFDAVAGRLNDVIRLEGGDAVHSLSVFHCIQPERVQNIQMVLRDEGIIVRLVSSEPDRAAMESRMRQRLAQVHPAFGAARFEYVDDVETNRAGKRRWFVDHRTHAPCAASPAS